MQSILRPVLFLALLAALATGLLACGGGDDAADQDVDTLLEETFSGSKKIESGRLALNAAIDIQEGDAGPEAVTLKIGGPFESEGEGKLPKFDIDVSFEGEGQSFSAGATSTGDKGFVNFQGTEYAVSDQVFQQFRQAYEQASKQGGEQDQSLQSLGLDPRKWLTDAKNAGEVKVGDTDTVKITGGVDVAKLLEDVNSALAKAGELGLQGQAGLPSQLTERQRKRVQDSLKDVSVEIYTGAEDKILRRMVVGLDIDAGADGTGKVDFDMQLLDLNEGQDIEEPEDTKPFEQLLEQLGGLGGLLGGTAGGSGGSGGASADPQSQAQIEEFTKCLEEAGSDQAAAQKCSELIQP